MFLSVYDKVPHVPNTFRGKINSISKKSHSLFQDTKPEDFLGWNSLSNSHMPPLKRKDVRKHEKGEPIPAVNLGSHESIHFRVLCRLVQNWRLTLKKPPVYKKGGKSLYGAELNTCSSVS